MPGGFEVLEIQCQLEARDQWRRRLLLTSHRQLGTHPLPDCKWRAKHPGVDRLVNIGKNDIETPKYHRDVTYSEEGVVEVEYLRAHEIFGTNSAENDDIPPDSLITKNTNTTVSIETSIGLRYLEEEN